MDFYDIMLTSNANYGKKIKTIQHAIGKFLEDGQYNKHLKNIINSKQEYELGLSLVHSLGFVKA